MRRLLVALCFICLAVWGAQAQDDSESDENGNNVMCELLAFYELAQFSEAYDAETKSSYAILANVQGPQNPECQEAATETEPERQIPVAATLQSDEWYEIEDVGCRVIVTGSDRLAFRVAIVGEGLQGLSVDVYFAGESQKAEMDPTGYIFGDSDPPTKVSSNHGRLFPLGSTYFDVTVDDQTFRLRWNREGKAYRDFMLECLDRQADADTPIDLEEGAWYQLRGEECVLVLSQLGENFNVQVVGDYSDKDFIEVTLPGETAPAAFDGELIDVVDAGPDFGELPFRRQWISGENFPKGAYIIMATIKGVEYKFVWDRKNLEYDTVHVVCLEQ